VDRFPAHGRDWPPPYANAPLTGFSQEVEHAERALKEVGKFPIEMTPDSMRIVGHMK
jgi:hypothetical protein